LMQSEVMYVVIVLGATYSAGCQLV
jgi:hypothetical protein